MQGGTKTNRESGREKVRKVTKTFQRVAIFVAQFHAVEAEDEVWRASKRFKVTYIE
jgi:hypothetical protein